MNPAWTERAFWLAAGMSLVVGASELWRRPSAALVAAPAVVPALDLRMPTSDSLIDATQVARELDLFRPGRTAVAGDAPQPAVMPRQDGFTTRPQLVLRGLVGGTSMEAIVDGVPGVEGATVFRTGETIGGVTLRAVRRDTAILVAKDTTWKLTVRRF